MKFLKKYRWLFFLIPAALGTYGYYLVYHNLPGAFYSAIRLYSMDIDIAEEDLNAFLQVARWIAPLASASALVIIFQKIGAGFLLRWKLHQPETIVVHGDGTRSELVKKTLGKNAVMMSDDICFRAKKHVLAFEEDTSAIAYLTENRTQLLSEKENKVYFAAFEYTPSDYEETGLIVENDAVNCARLFWQRYPLEDVGGQRIAVIGFGSRGQRILEHGLLMNVPVVRTPIEYHIFGGDQEAYCNWHPQLDKMVALNKTDPNMDSLFFHPDVDVAGVTALEGMDRLILVMDRPDKNIVCLDRLLGAGVKGQIYINCDRELLDRLEVIPRQQTVGETEEIIAFGGAEELYTAEVIMHGALNKMARKAHANYVRNLSAAQIREKYQCCAGCEKEGVCGDCPDAEKTWNALTPFEKASNIAAADHMLIKRRIFEKATAEGILEKMKPILCESEHIRWCRFHYLNNWSYAEKRDNSRRLHPCLVPNEELSPEDQEKSWWGYMQLIKEKKAEEEAQ